MVETALVKLTTAFNLSHRGSTATLNFQRFTPETQQQAFTKPHVSLIFTLKKDAVEFNSPFTAFEVRTRRASRLDSTPTQHTLSFVYYTIHFRRWLISSSWGGRRCCVLLQDDVACCCKNANSWGKNSARARTKASRMLTCFFHSSFCHSPYHRSIGDTRARAHQLLPVACRGTGR